MPTKTESPTRKVTVTLPATLVAQLDDCIPSRQRSAFIAYAIREQLAIVEQADALEASAGTCRERSVVGRAARSCSRVPPNLLAVSGDDSKTT